MKNRLVMVSVLLLALAGLAGCINMDDEVRIKKDGSGQYVMQGSVEQYKLVAMMDEEREGDGEPSDEEILKAARGKAEEAAQAIEGAEVAIVEIVAGDKPQIRAVINFPDVNKLVLINLPGSDDDDAPPMFQFDNGELSIRNPFGGEGLDQMTDSESLSDPEQAEGIKDMLADSFIGIRIVAEDGISETNARHVDQASGTVTFMSVPLGEYISAAIDNKNEFDKISALEDNSEKVTAIEALVPGLKFDPSEIIRIKLK